MYNESAVLHSYGLDSSLSLRVFAKFGQVVYALEVLLGAKTPPLPNNGSFPYHPHGGGSDAKRPGHCDFFAAWGTRTEGGRLLGSRNLDWNKDTGVAKSKLVAVYDIAGHHPYATVGFAGAFAGALAGMSGAGLAVSQANLDNSQVSFDGFAWPLRLRAVLERAGSLRDALSFWNATNNTAAFNYMVASASEPAAAALETRARYTAAFRDDDAREAAAVWTWPGNATRPTHIGAPMREAVWRSNHALDPVLMRTQEPLWPDTVWRYQTLHNQIAQYPSHSGAVMTAPDAVKIAALLGIKGRAEPADYFKACDSATDPPDFAAGDHVMSIVYDPSKARLYAAWEDGTGTKGWRPAACNAYVELDLSPWFRKK